MSRAADRARTAQALRLPRGAWSADRTEALEVPADWRVEMLPMADGPGLGHGAIEAALDAPLGAPPLPELVRGARSVVVAIDDSTRPTRTLEILGPLVDRLGAAGVADDRLTIVVATGAHRAVNRLDVERKVGAELAARVRVLGHDPEGALVDTGVDLAGVRIRLNQVFCDADVRIGIGAVMPHPFAGFSGGAKVVIPGLADFDTLARSHRFALMGLHGGRDPDRNKFRAAIEAAVRHIGLHWTVGVVVNSARHSAAVVAGDLEVAHRVAAGRAAAIGATLPPGDLLDGLVLNAYPKDGELLQIEAAFVSLRSGIQEWLAPGAPVVLTAACPEGLGMHRLFGPGGRLFRVPSARTFLADHALLIHAPGVSEVEARTTFWEGYPFHASWESVLTDLEARLPRSPRIGVLACGPLQVASAGHRGPCTTR